MLTNTMKEDSNERMTHEEVFHALRSKVTIPFTLHEIKENLTVEYTQGTNPREIGYDALRGFPIDKICCTGYPQKYLMRLAVIWLDVSI